MAWICDPGVLSLLNKCRGTAYKKNVDFSHSDSDRVEMINHRVEMIDHRVEMIPDWVEIIPDWVETIPDRVEIIALFILKPLNH